MGCEAISILKDARQHFETKHQVYTKLNLYIKIIKAASLVKNLDKEQKLFKVANTENSVIIRINFEMSREIVATGKSFIFNVSREKLEVGIPECQLW